MFINNSIFYRFCMENIEGLYLYMIFNGLCMFLMLVFSTVAERCSEKTPSLKESTTTCIRDHKYLNKQSLENTDDKDHVRSVNEIMSFKANKHDQRHSTKYEFQNMDEWINGQKEALNNASTNQSLEMVEKTDSESTEDSNLSEENELTEDIELEPTD